MIYRDSYIKINIDNLIFNINRLQTVSKKKMIAVIKANAYGCGDVEIAKILANQNLDMLAVSSLDEAMNLRNNGIKTNILILGYVNPKYINICIENNLSIPTVSLDYVKELCQHNIQGLKIHLKIDTGMNRIGLTNKQEAKQALELLKTAKIEGIFTHFACSDSEDNRFTNKQFLKFKETIAYLNYPFQYIHTSNTDATTHYHDDISNYVRCGLGLYGLSEYEIGLKPVVSLLSKVINCKLVSAFETVGYGATYQCQQDEWIITIPIGYADGWLRKNQGRKAYINGEYAEFVGRVCMDQCMLKVKQAVPVGTEVELFGKNISLKSVAQDLDTIPYEILTILSDRLTKIYYRHNLEVYEETPRFKK